MRKHMNLAQLFAAKRFHLAARCARSEVSFSVLGGFRLKRPA